jgi:hypothetical protein
MHKTLQQIEINVNTQGVIHRIFLFFFTAFRPVGKGITPLSSVRWNLFTLPDHAAKKNSKKLAYLI